MIFSFSGCGWLFPFHFGVAKYIQDYMVSTQHSSTDEPFVKATDILHDLQDHTAENPHAASTSHAFAGVSGGATVAAALAYHIPIEEIFEEAIKKYDTGLFRMCDAVMEVLDVMFKKTNVNKLKSHVLYVQVSPATSLIRPRAHLITHFPSKAYCKHVIRASSHIPILGGLLPYHVKGVGLCYDGGLAGMFPTFPDKISRKHHIIKVDATGWIPNSDLHLGFKVPYMWCFLPRPPHIMRLIYRLGFLKAEQFFNPHASKLHYQEIVTLIEALRPSYQSKM